MRGRRGHGHTIPSRHAAVRRRKHRTCLRYGIDWVVIDFCEGSPGVATPQVGRSVGTTHADLGEIWQLSRRSPPSRWTHFGGKVPLGAPTFFAPGTCFVTPATLGGVAPVSAGDSRARGAPSPIHLTSHDSSMWIKATQARPTHGILLGGLRPSPRCLRISEERRMSLGSTRVRATTRSNRCNCFETVVFW